MHTLTGNRDQVLQLMGNTIMKLQTSTEASAASVAGEPGEGADVLAKLNQGYLSEQLSGTASAASVDFADQQNVDWYVPRDQAVAVFQSAMDEYLEENNAPEGPAPVGGGAVAASVGEGELSHPEIAANIFYQGAAPGAGVGEATAAALMEQFDNLDPRWASWLLVKAQGWLKGKRPFISHKSPNDFQFGMKDEATIAVVGDWGGGNSAAQEVAKRINEINPDHVIHLGDVYYSGTPKETKERFLKYWPFPKDPGMSLALNSNHEMYGGGYGYFDSTLPAFKQPASYFNLSNANWQFIGLDTGYDEHDLHPPQADWLAAQLNTDKKTILFSHHQLFSAYETTDARKLQNKVQPFLDARKIYGWIWGHEHLCVAYQPYMGIKGVCLGNGCFPYNPPTNQPQVPVEWMNDRPQPNDPDYRGIHTFALLKVTPAQVEIQYIDQDGFVGYTQTWG
jgi:predicted phosphodiesterase